MSGKRRLRVVIVAVIALSGAACSAGGVPSGGAEDPTPPASTSATLASAPAPTPEPTPTPTPEIAFRELETPAGYSRSGAEAVDGTTAVGWVQIGKASEPEAPAVWDTTTGTLRVLAVPAEFVHPSGDTFVRLEGVSGTTAVGTGILGTKGKRGQQRAMVWDTETGDLRILDIPAGYTQAEAHAIDGTMAVGQVWSADGETGRPVAWDTESGAIRILTMPPGYDCGDPHAISGATVVGSRCDGDLGLPIVWNPDSADAQAMDLLPATLDGFARAVDGTTAVGDCCFREEGTRLPLIWDTTTGSVRQLTLPAPFESGRADGVSGAVVVGSADSTPLVWDLATGLARVLPAPAGDSFATARYAVSGRTVVGSACEPAASASDNARCVAAAWTLP